MRGAGLKGKHRQGELDPQFAKYRATRIEELRTRINNRPYFINAGQMVDSIESWDTQENEGFSSLAQSKASRWDAQQSLRLSARQKDYKSQPTTDKDEPEAKVRRCEQLTSTAWLTHQAKTRETLDLTSKHFSDGPAYEEYSRLVEAEQAALEEYQQLQQQDFAALLNFNTKKASVPESQEPAILCHSSTWKAGLVVREDSASPVSNRMDLAIINAKDGTYIVKIKEGEIMGVSLEAGRDTVVEDKK